MPGGSGFPPPSAKVMSGHPLWDWCAVAAWLHDKTLLNRETAIAARTIKEGNASLLASHMPHDGLMQRLEALEPVPAC